MADLIKIKGGRGEVPELQDRELAYSKSEKALYIGTEEGNVRLGGCDDAKIEELYTIINGLSATITALDTAIAEINAKIEDISARLEALEMPSE